MTFLETNNRPMGASMSITRSFCLPMAVLLAIGLTEQTRGDYTFSCWPNGWRKNANDQSPDVFGIETSRYGFTLDVADFRKVGFGRIDKPTGYQQALDHKADKLKQLPPAELLIDVEVDGEVYRARACRAGQETGVKRLSHIRLWESGRFVQHYDFLGLDLRNANDDKLACDATLDLVAWPDNLTINLRVSPTSSLHDAVLRLALRGDIGNWSKEETIATWNRGEVMALSLNCPIDSARQLRRENILVIDANDQHIPVRFDETKNCLVATVRNLKRDWRTGYTDIRHYDEFEISVKGLPSKAAIPLLLDLRPPANITGLCPILCDENGRPTGIPVQLSKNWHHQPTGSYLMAYAMLPAVKDTTYILRIAYGFFGTLPSASHAQLSLIGYGGNGRWDQLAIGCWGETICFDMDMSLVDVAITDVRSLMVRDGVGGRKWGWTNAGWGGDWLHIQDARQRKFFWTDLKTAYLSHGPCLTDVKYAGCYGVDREVDFYAQVSTLRTDDYCRTFQNLKYTFNQDVSAEKVWIYKLGRTSHYKTPRLAYGNANGLIKEHEAPDNLPEGQVFLEATEWSGPGPFWLAFVGASETTGKKNKPNGYRGLIVRRHKAVIDGKIYDTPTFRAPVHKASPTNFDIELLPPAGIREFEKGDQIELDLELITLPRIANDYYGPNESFRKHLVENPNSWKTTHREAKGNDLKVFVSGGQVSRRYPIVIRVDEPEVEVTIQGGTGAVPIRFEDLDSANGDCLFRVAGGKRIPFDQSVRGNDFWQTDYNEAAASYSMTFNLPLDGVQESRWILAK
jgi:hypothetical protein